MELSPTAKKFVLHWGEMGTRWGVNRTVAQIHALLFYLGKPLHAEEIAEILGVARSNVSNSLRELQSWQLIKPAHRMDDRRDYYETSLDVWTLFRTVVAERRRREFDPTVALLRECVAEPAFDREDAEAQQRVKESLAFMETLSSWTDQMLRLDTGILKRLLKLGARIQQYVRL